MTENHINSKALAPDGIIAINKEQKIIVFNEAAGRITGFHNKDILSRDINFLFQNSDEKKSYLLRSLLTGEIFSNISLTITCENNKDLLTTASITPLTQPNQGVIGIIIVFRDTNETLSLHHALANKNNEILHEKNKLETIFNSLLEGTFTINSDWEITSFNKAAEEITGFSTSEAINKKYWEILLSEDTKQDSQLKSFIIAHHPTLLRETTIIKKNRSRVPVRINSAPLMDISGEKIGRVVTFEDISIIKNLSDHIEERFHFNNIIGRSKSMLKVYNLMQNVINTDSTVLITGESGTGKEIIARSIHLNSERKSTPFIAVNCTAFAETLLESELFGHDKGAFTGAVHTKPGRFELAGEGTLFLDEIGDIPLSVQVKLLRVLENRQFERVGGTSSLELKARIISATHRDLEKEIREGRFREDLYYRINVINIHLPPLHDREDDIPSLVNHFMEKFNKKFKKDIHYVSPNALRVITHYKWPGNIRELENIIEHAFVVCNSDAIRTEHLPEKLQLLVEELNLNDENNPNIKPLDNIEKELIESTLKKFKGNRVETASALGINKSTLWRKMKKFNLK
ncbi:MAG: sigma 54-interacting transcriptional regulator [Bacteroidetes bacterium]|nr:sigma 54-interacting transcriptional regulator [Bacteroidota bacterium]